jgi:glycosyltransferase involved in cell wall biosynthesis
MNRKLGIAMLSHMASSVSPTGAEHSLALLARGLRERGHRVVVVVPGPWALGRALEEAGIEVETIPCRACWLVYYHPRPLPGAFLKWARFALADSGGRSIAAFLREWRPDVVHVNCLPHLRGAERARAAGFPVAWHIREILPPGTRRRWFASRLSRDATRVVAVSEAVGEWLRDEGLGERVTVIHNGVQPAESSREPHEARASLGLPREARVAGLFGQILPHKGVMQFVEAGERALGAGGDLRFVVAGAGPDGFVEEVRAQMAAASRPDRFHLLPPQPNAADLMAAADMVCLTTTTPDPLPRTVLEAMAAGKPVIAFRSGGAPEMVVDGRTGRLVDDVEGLAAAMIELAADEDLRSSMGNAGARRAREEFTLDRHVDRMESLFREIAS